MLGSGAFQFGKESRIDFGIAVEQDQAVESFRRLQFQIAMNDPVVDRRQARVSGIVKVRRPW